MAVGRKTRGKRREKPPPLPAGGGGGGGGGSGDEVDEFVANRHKILLNDDENYDGRRRTGSRRSGGDGDSDASDLYEDAPVLDLEDHDNEDDEVDDEEDDGDDEDSEEDAGGGWRRASDFYGGDNAEYDLMSSDDEEDELLEEEAEAVKLQRAHAGGMALADYRMDAASDDEFAESTGVRSRGGEEEVEEGDDDGGGGAALGAREATVMDDVRSRLSVLEDLSGSSSSDSTDSDDHSDDDAGGTVTAARHPRPKRTAVAAAPPFSAREGADSRQQRENGTDALKQTNPELFLLLDDLKALLPKLQPGGELAGNEADGAAEDAANGGGARQLRLWRYHATSNYCVNILLYLSLRAEGRTALKEHPVIAQLAAAKALVRRLEALRSSHTSAPPPPPHDEELGDDERSRGGPPALDGENSDESGESEASAPVEADRAAPRVEGARFWPGEEDDDEAFRALTGATSRNLPPRRPRTVVSSGYGGLAEDDEERSEDNDGHRPGRATSTLLSRSLRRVQQPGQRRMGAAAAPSGDGDVDDTTPRPYASQRPPPNLSAAEMDAAPPPDDDDEAATGDGDEFDGEDELYARVARQKRAAREERLRRVTAAATAPHVYTFRDELERPDERRAASKDILRNRGLTPYRTRKRRNPRVRHRDKYERQSRKLRTAVRTFDADARRGAAYSGERSGVNMRARASVRL